MVRVSFIVEGKVEKILIDHLDKTGWLQSKGVQKVGPTVDAKGGGNLCPRNIETYISQVQQTNPDHIFILTDLECDPCFTQTKARLGGCENCTVVIAKKAVEAWFMADGNVVNQLTSGEHAGFDFPEQTQSMPYETMKEVMKASTGRGPGPKALLAKKVLKNGFDIARAAQHEHCQSAKYFINKIEELANASA